MILSYNDWLEEFNRIREIAKESVFLADCPTLEEAYRLGKYPAQAFLDIRAERDQWIADRGPVEATAK